MPRPSNYTKDTSFNLRVLEADAQRQSLEATALAQDSNSDEYAVMREMEAEFERDDFASDWKA